MTRRVDPSHKRYARILVVLAPALALVFAIIQRSQRDQWLAFALLEVVMLFATLVAVAELRGWLSAWRHARTTAFQEQRSRRDSVTWRPDRIGAAVLFSLLGAGSVFMAYVSLTHSAGVALIAVCVSFVFGVFAYVFFVDVINVNTLRIDSQTLSVTFRPLPSPFHRDVRVALAPGAVVLSHFESFRSGHAYQLVLRQPGRQDVVLGYVDSLEEADVLVGAIRCLLAGTLDASRTS